MIAILNSPLKEKIFKKPNKPQVKTVVPFKMGLLTLILPSLDRCEMKAMEGVLVA